MPSKALVMWKESEPQVEQHVESMDSPTLPVEQTLSKPAKDSSSMDKKQLELYIVDGGRSKNLCA
jgi:hypothetical protein